MPKTATNGTDEQLDGTATEDSSSTGEQEQVQDANAEGNQGADSSTTGGTKDAKEDKRTLLSVVQDVLKKDENSEESSTSDGGKKAGDDSTADGKKDGDKPDAKGADDDARLPFHNHPRWQQIVAENRDLKEDATVGKSVRSYQEGSGISNDEFKDLLNAGYLGKTDPEKAIPVVEAYLEKLKAATGDKLPDDLSQKVKDGYMDETTAREVSKERAKAAQATARANAAESKTEANNARAATQEVVGAVNTWEQQQIAKDPDYAKKKELVHTFVRDDFTRNGRPATKEDAIKVPEAALKKATQILGGVASPKPTPKMPSSKTGKTGVTTQPKTLREAVHLAANR